MDNELTTKIINNEEFNILDFRSDFSKFKKLDKKYKIALAIIIAIILCLLFIIIFKSFHTSPIPNEQTKQAKQTEENKETQNNLNLTNVPEFKKYYSNFPGALKINENGVIEFDNNVLNNAPLDKLIFEKEYDYEYSKIEIDQESSSTNSENVDLALSCNLNFLFHNDIKFKNKVEEAKKESNKNSILMVKKKLFSISMKRKHMEPDEFFLKKIKDIANQESLSDEEKALKLDKIFNEYGYFIPSKITIGGYFYKEINQIENENLMNNINNFEDKLQFNKFFSLNSSVEYNKEYEELLKVFFSEEKIKIIGGDSSKKSFSEWEESLYYENSKIIEYSNLIEMNSLIKDFLDKDIQDKLNNALNLVDKKYERRKKYYNNIKSAKESIITLSYKGDKAIRNGLCNEDNDLIYSYRIKIREKGIRYANEPFSDIIVGWKIISNWNDGTNGDYEFTNPILTYSINFKFKSKTNYKIDRAQNYDLVIYLMKFPE